MRLFKMSVLLGLLAMTGTAAQAYHTCQGPVEPTSGLCMDWHEYIRKGLL